MPPAPVPSRLWPTNITHTSSVIRWEVNGVINDDAHYILGYQRADGEGENEVIKIEGEAFKQVSKYCTCH